MESDHRAIIGDSRQMSELDDGEVDLVVTSPPYPMIEMWDDVFSGLNNEIGDYLESGAGQEAFELMHKELKKTWTEVSRVLIDGGIACVNVGDATRKVAGNFRVYQNHARIIDAFEDLGFEPLPDILWRKPGNSAAKFMGSGMLPPNQYVTLEHEYILIFRKGKDQRSFEPGSERRYSSAYFHEERNKWFSDVWKDIAGTLQTLQNNELRERSAAFPLKIPYRLINMYSIYGDTVLDPFWGTGTTSLAAMVAGRNSVGYELEEEFTRVFKDRIDEVSRISGEIVSERIERHREFVRNHREQGGELKYDAENYDFPVKTKQEKQIRFYTVDRIRDSGQTYTSIHTEFRGSDESTAKTGQATFGSDF